MTSLLPSFLALGTLMVLAVYFGLTTRFPPSGAIRQSVLSWAAITLLVQGVHFAEEFLTGFHQQFPQVFGIEAMSSQTFIVFNLGFIGLWLMSMWGLHHGVRTALILIWFLALAAVANAVAHPLLALVSASYFPGLVSAIPLGYCGWHLLQSLRKTAINSPQQKNVEEL